MFRHERAQRGRYRQFHQMGVEALGVADPALDAEQVAMLHGLFTELGLGGLDVVVNSVGGPEDRPAYRAALVAFFTPHAAELCEDCRRRLEKNPLRILDCKNPGCRKLAAGAPSMASHLGEAARDHFDRFRAALQALEVPHRVDERLVRGLDYYTGTIYEIRSASGDLGAQNTLVGGGRYDKLVEEMGGPPTPAVGFAIGVERLVLTLPGEPETYEPRTDVFVVALGEPARAYALGAAARLRARGMRAEVDHRGGSMKSQLKRADKLRARVVVLVGENELARSEVMLRDMDAGDQRPVAQAELDDELARLLGR
jgi:histidyl-tRNA synthetase